MILKSNFPDLTSWMQLTMEFFSDHDATTKIGFLLAPIRRIFNTTQVIGLGSSHFFFPNFRSTCSSPNLRLGLCVEETWVAVLT
ncbi:hypothetical protein CMV_022481 [Castanea mollissima]|uniref:Uncharacterized protein n=1 Tax=Castanea mollissima TaxID=60419 RepID=A0A8J4QWD4_9ROSI|nr:hypothetical protein CMV_022481 [Castanea mollissima]